MVGNGKFEAKDIDEKILSDDEQKTEYKRNQAYYDELFKFITLYTMAKFIKIVLYRDYYETNLDANGNFSTLDDKQFALLLDMYV